jgi:putative peptide zinc metalloprotease protein
VFLLATTATTTWAATLAINLSPFMKFDGYYVLSDWLGINNLFDRSFKLGRWKLRELLFGLGDAPPEALDKSLTRVLVLFSWSVWLYRFLLFLGIALLVYFLFFKALGLILMAVEVVWFIGMPIYSELREWGRRRGQIRLNLNSLLTISVLAILVLLFLLPLDRKVDAPAVLRARVHTDIYAPISARITGIDARIDQRVSAGQSLLRLASPALEKQLAAADKRARLAGRQLELASADIALRHRRLVAESELAALLARIEGLRKQQAKLAILAPMDGTVTGLAAPKIGQWVGANDLLIGLNGHAVIIEAYVAEQDVGRIEAGSVARFIPDNLDQPVRFGTVIEIHALNTAALLRPILASVFGGDIPVRADRGGKLVPQRSVYKVLIEIDRGAGAPRPVETTLPGVASIDARQRSFGSGIWAFAAGVLVRESGFEPLRRFRRPMHLPCRVTNLI